MCTRVADKLVVLGTRWLGAPYSGGTHGYKPAGLPAGNLWPGKETDGAKTCTCTCALTQQGCGADAPWVVWVVWAKGAERWFVGLFCAQHLAKSLQFAFIFIVVMPCPRFVSRLLLHSRPFHLPSLLPAATLIGPFSYASSDCLFFLFAFLFSVGAAVFLHFLRLPLSLTVATF